MTEPAIVCPNCKTSIKLTESLAAPLLEATKRQFEHKLAENESRIAMRERLITEQQADIAKKQTAIEEQVTAQLRLERGKIAADEQRRARALLHGEIEKKSAELDSLNEIVKDRDTKLAEAMKAQAETVRKQRELDDKLRELDLTIEKKVQETAETIRAKAAAEANEAHKLRDAEKDEKFAAMTRQIEELKRKAEQGSQQTQGDVLEVELESMLRAKFPIDHIERVAKGASGGDIVHRVIAPGGQHCGTILWESKRTKNWSNAWLPKLRDDVRAAKADIALIVSNALPDGVDPFGHVDGVYVTGFKCAVPVAITVRQSLIELAAARRAHDGQQTKMEMVYHYLTGPRFEQRVQAVVEKFKAMQSDLNKERTFMLQQWAKREMHIQAVVQSTMGMHGDLQGIAGDELKAIDSLDVKLLEAASA